MSKPFKRYLVTSALPYANGPVHIGHLAGVYIPSDIYTRYLRLKGYDVISVCGSDEHGVPITIKARKEGVTPQQIVDRYHQLIKSSFEGLGMSFDIYSRTSSKTHAATASEFFRKLYDEGKFIERTSEQYYDEETQTFLADRYIVGTCPRCGNDRAYGDQCEKCGSTLSPDELISPHSAVSGSVPVKRATKHWYLPLDQYEGFLREWILEGHKEWKTNVYGQCKSWLDMGLQPRAVSRDLDWGIPVPVEGAEGKVLYVWFDALLNYLTGIKYGTDDAFFHKYWPASLHLVGKEIVRFHTIIWPIMLHAMGLEMPQEVYGHGWLVVDGDKMSKSKGEFLTVSLLEEKGYDPLAYRFFCLQSHYRKSLVFTWENLDNATVAYNKLLSKIAALKDEGEVDRAAFDEYKAKFMAAMDNDLNTSMAVTVLYDVLKAKTNDKTKLALLDSFDTVLGLKLLEKAAALRAKQAAAPTAGEFAVVSENGEANAEVEALIRARADAKKAKNFAEADRIRDELKAQGIEITDVPGGAKWKRI